MNTEQLDWLVGSPTGIRTRICYEAPSGAHPLTPQHIRERYITEVRNSALVVWHSQDSNLGGIRAGIDEIAWRDADIEYFDTSFCRPAKGHGWVTLSLHPHNANLIPLICSDSYDETIYNWHKSVTALLERFYPGCTRLTDGGVDA